VAVAGVVARGDPFALAGARVVGAGGAGLEWGAGAVVDIGVAAAAVAGAITLGVAATLAILCFVYFFVDALEALLELDDAAANVATDLGQAAAEEEQADHQQDDQVPRSE
jgi:hypothetical protein